MRYLMKQKLLCMGNDFSILDEQGQERYYIDGKALAFGNQLSFQDMNRREIAFISQKLMTFRPTYTVTSKKQPLAKIFKSLMSFRDHFVIDVPGPNDITVVGRLMEHEYMFYRNKKQIAAVSKKWFRASDTYGIDISSSTDSILLLSCAVVIDLMCHQKRR